MYRSSLFPFLFIVLICVGCRNENSQVDEADPASNSGAETKDDQAEMQSATGYLPIFTDELPQNIISNRMEKNFDRFHNTVDKSELVHFPSAGLLLYQPEEFERSKKFTGFQGKGFTIVVLTNPFSMADTTRGIIGDVVNAGHSGVLSTKTISVDGKQGVFYANRETYGGNEIVKYTSAFGDENFSWIITGTFLPDAEEEHGEKILKSVLNARVSDQPRLPPGEDVDFTMRPNRLKLNDGFIDKLVYTKDGKFPVNTIKDPIFQVGKSLMNFPTENRKEFARALVSPGPTIDVQLISSQLPVSIDGLEGFEHIAVGIDNESEEPLQIYSVTLYEGDSGYVMHGWVTAENSENYIADFRGLAKSFKRRSTNRPAERDNSGDDDSAPSNAASDGSR